MNKCLVYFKLENKIKNKNKNKRKTEREVCENLKQIYFLKRRHLMGIHVVFFKLYFDIIL